LTVMFCDVVSSTELAARLGAETWGEVVGAYQAFGGKCVERYEGYLAQVLGDGLLVYFGYPQGHEDDAERAVRCALEIRDGLPALNQFTRRPVLSTQAFSNGRFEWRTRGTT